MCLHWAIYCPIFVCGQRSKKGRGGGLVVSMLAFYSDDPRSIPADLDPNFNFRTSKIGPFTNNVAMVLYKCDQGQKVLTLHQEYPVKLDACDDLLCDWDTFLDAYKVNNFALDSFPLTNPFCCFRHYLA